MAKANLETALNPFTKKLQRVRKDAFAYHTIEANHTVQVPAQTEYFLSQDLTLAGDLDLIGDLVIWDLTDIKSPSLRTITEDATQTIGDDIIVIDATSNAVDLTLLDAANLELGHSLKIIVKEEGTYAVSVIADSGDTISGDASVTLYKYEVLDLNVISSTEWQG